MNLHPHHLAMFLLCYYGIVQAKVVDIHLSGPSEWNLEHDAKEHQEIKKAIKDLNDPDSSLEAKSDAYEVLEETNKLCTSSR